MDDTTLLATATRKQALSLRVALTVFVFFALVTASATMAIIRSTIARPYKGAMAILALLALVGTLYGLTQALLALVATTGERRELSRRQHAASPDDAASNSRSAVEDDFQGRTRNVSDRRTERSQEPPGTS